MPSVLDLKLADILKGLRDKKFSVTQLCQFYLNRIEKFNPHLKAVLTVHKKVLQEARQMDLHWGEYQNLPLAGVPVLLKDSFCTKGIRTTAGSRMLEHFIPPYSATVVKKLQQAGALIMGKCNQDEFAMGNSNENSAFSPVYNPWNRDYVAGGSSGGSAAAVSAGLAPVTLGTDTGGSIRQPASFCNLVGMKPTYTRVSRYGIIAYGSSLDQAGPLTRFVEDNALVLEVISGFDPQDNTSSEAAVPSWFKNLKADVDGLRVGFLDPRLYGAEGSAEVVEILEQVKNCFKKKGARVQEVSLDFMDLLAPVYYLISTSEASSNLARYDGIRYGYRKDFKDLSPSLDQFYSQTRSQGFGSEVKRRILMGTYCLSKGYYEEYYGQALRIRRQIRDDMRALFNDISLLVTPVGAKEAFRVGENRPGSLKSYLSDSFTVPANLCGFPAIGVPGGFSKTGLPVGVQLMGSHFNEQVLFDAAFLLQEEMKVAFQRPDLKIIEDRLSVS